jgi:hypothetical protein
MLRDAVYIYTYTHFMHIPLCGQRDAVGKGVGP